jgi:hypothetical protein
MSTESDLFHQEVPKRLQIALYRSILDGCAAAHDVAKANHSGEWFHEAVYMNRRLEVEKRLRDLVLPKGFALSIEKTPSTHYSKIQSKKIVLTAVTRTRRVSWVKPEPYRETIALPAQTELFADDRLCANAGKRLHGLVIYGGPPSRRLPSQARIVFPTMAGDFAPGAIELASLYPEVLAAYQLRPEAAPVVNVALRNPVKKYG